jgi:hypothetical protein
VRTSEPTLGICKAARCIDSGRGPVELYDGPGKFCPECGETLQWYEPDRPPRAWTLPPPESPPAGAAESSPGATAPSASATASANAAAPSASATTPPLARSRAVAPPARNGRRTLFAAAAAVLVAVGGYAAAHIARAGAAPATVAVGVCGSSMANRLAGDVLRSFAAQQPALADRFALRGTGCDVAFFTAPRSGMRAAAGHGALAQTIGHDAIVAVVNPLNPLGEVTLDQLHGVLAGTIRDWSGLHGAPAPITVYLPVDGSDEANIASASIMHRAPVGSAVVRLPTSADVVNAVSAANGRNAIGIVAFSAAVPAKVVALTGSPAPSSISIADGRYPLALDVTVAAWNAHDPAVPTLMAYVSSGPARAVASSDRIVP